MAARRTSACKTARRQLAYAARWWRSLRDQEADFGHFARELARGMTRHEAPRQLQDWIERITVEESRHVSLCEEVIAYLGVEPSPYEPKPSPVIDSDDTIAEAIVVGFLVGETISVGGFVASLAHAEDPFVRRHLKQIAREEVGHAQFGEAASAWALRDWSIERRRSLWGRCVWMMESYERRFGGVEELLAKPAACPALGAPAPTATHHGMLRAVQRHVLPRLARLDVIATPQK